MLRKYKCEVFDSEGTLAIQRVDLIDVPDEQSDAVYVQRLHNENVDSRPFVTTDEEYQEIVDVIVKAVEEPDEFPYDAVSQLVLDTLVDRGYPREIATERMKALGGADYEPFGKLVDSTAEEIFTEDEQTEYEGVEF